MRFLLILSFINVLFLSAQKPEDKIDIYSFNQKFFEYLVKTGIDSVRESYRLPALRNDTFCYMAAIDQAYHLVDDTAFDHFRPSMPEKGSPLKRVQFFGGKNSLVSENLAKIYINKVINYSRKGYIPKKFFITSYKEAADFLISAWVESSSHFLNIISRDFYYTGLAAIYNEEDNSLICVQVFASNDTAKTDMHITNQPAYNTIKTNNQWGIEFPQSNEANESNLNKLLSLVSVMMKGDDIFLNFGKDSQWQNVINEKNDGFAIHFIPESQYDCSGKWYYSDSEEMSGIITKPVYRQQMTKKFNSSDTGRFILFLGSVPEGYSEPYEMNILLLKNNIVSEVIYTNHICGEKKDFSIDVSLLSPDLSTYNYIPSEEYFKQGNNIINTALKEYNGVYKYLSQIYLYTNQQVLDRITLRLDTIQKYLFYNYLNGKITLEQIDSLPVTLPENYYYPERNFYNLYYNKLIFKYFYKPDESDNLLLAEVLDNIKKSENEFAEGIYNYFAFKILQGQSDFNINELKTSLEKIKNKVDSNSYNRLNLFFSIQYLSKITSDTNNKETIDALNFIYNYYKNNFAPDDERLNAAKLLIYYRLFNFAYFTLSPIVDNVFTNKEACILDLKLYYSGKLQINYNQYFKKILDSANYLTDEEWLELFKGPCRLNLQLLNNEQLWNLYCSKIK